MTPQPLTMIEQHCEKLALTLAALVLVCMSWSYLLSPAPTVMHDGREVSARQFADSIHREALELQILMNAASAPDTPVPAYHRQLAAAHAAGLWSADGVSLPRQLVAVTPMGTPIPSPLPDQAPVCVIAPLPPARPGVVSGLAVLPPEDDSPSNAASAITWVRVRTVLDVARQERAWREAGYPAYACRVVLVDARAQRQEMRAGQPVSAWAEVELVGGRPD